MSKAVEGGVEVSMGCFPYTCAVSSFPIELGDRVRFMALARNPDDKGGFVCHADGIWQPITLPIKGTYNEYGSILEIEEGPVTEAFFRVLNERAIERDCGPNTVHDVAVKRDMSRDLWLRALWEGRVRIRDRRKGTPLQVTQTMILDSVWQLLADECPGPVKDLEGLLRLPLVLGPFENLLSSPLDEVLLPAMVDLYRVQASLVALGRHWAQGTSINRQGGEQWPIHERFLAALLAISTTRRVACEIDP